MATARTFSAISVQPRVLVILARGDIKIMGKLSVVAKAPPPLAELE